VNTVVLALEYFGQPATYAIVLDALNQSFAAVFLGEVVLKLMALRTKLYFKDNWYLLLKKKKRSTENSNEKNIIKRLCRENGHGSV
jgi:RNase P protein component